jgi:hypothetical protein
VATQIIGHMSPERKWLFITKQAVAAEMGLTRSKAADTDHPISGLVAPLSSLMMKQGK